MKQAAMFHIAERWSDLLRARRESCPARGVTDARVGSADCSAVIAIIPISRSKDTHGTEQDGRGKNREFSAPVDQRAILA